MYKYSRTSEAAADLTRIDHAFVCWSQEVEMPSDERPRQPFSVVHSASGCLPPEGSCPGQRGCPVV